MKVINYSATNLVPTSATKLSTTGAMVDIPAGHAALIALPIAVEGVIGRFIVKQLSVGRSGGTAVAFNAAIYTLPVVAVGVGAAQATLPDSAPIFEAIPIASTASGQVLRNLPTGYGYLFRNDEGTPTEAVRKLYVYIAPTAAGGATKWEYAVSLTTDIG